MGEGKKRASNFEPRTLSGSKQYLPRRRRRPSNIGQICFRHSHSLLLFFALRYFLSLDLSLSLSQSYGVKFWHSVVHLRGGGCVAKIRIHSNWSCNYTVLLHFVSFILVEIAELPRFTLLNVHFTHLHYLFYFNTTRQKDNIIMLSLVVSWNEGTYCRSYTVYKGFSVAALQLH